MMKQTGGKLAVILVVIVALAVIGFLMFGYVGNSSSSDSCYIEAMANIDADKGKPLPELKNPRVVIIKSSHSLEVYDGDAEVKIYRAGFGKCEGDKSCEGDKRTPEGEFYVCTKNPDSKFTLSLGLSYPNIEDAERGLRDGLIGRDEYDKIAEAIRNGHQPPWDTKLGGAIMIHGSGSGSDWTLGCIALDDDDIRELFDALPVGTPVEIRP